MPATPRAQAIAALIDPVVPNLPDAPQNITVDPKTWVNVPAADLSSFGGKGVLTASNVDSVQAVVVTQTSANLTRGSRNIQGAIMASGFWKMVAVIKAGGRTKTTSVVWNGTTSSTIADAVVQAKAWRAPLSDTMGNLGMNNLPLYDQTAGSPYIVAIRITDAQLPRFGGIYKPGPNEYDSVGKASGGVTASNMADFISTALSLRLQGIASVVPTGGSQVAPFPSFANHALYGVPDQCVVNGDQLITTFNVAGATPPQFATYDSYLLTYLTYLSNTDNRLGFMMQDPNQVKATLSNFLAVGTTAWSFQATANPWVAGDRIAITGANNPNFNGRYVIASIVGGVITIANAPPTTQPAPTTARGQRYQQANGNKNNVFAQIQPQVGGWITPYGLQVAKRNPARVYTGLSFRRKRRKLH